MKLARKVGATSEIWQIFIQDSSSTTGAGLTGLTNASSGLTAYYHRDTDTTATAISLVTMTVGTFTSSGFKEIDSTNMPGWYQFCPPNAALASGAKSCGFHLKGATNMAPLPIEVDLDAQVDISHAAGTAVTLDANNVLNVSSKYWAGTAITATSIPVATAAGAAGGLFIAGTNAATTITTGLTTTFTGSLTGSVGSVTGAVGSVTGAVGSVTGAVGSVAGNVGGNVTGSVGSISGITFPTNFATLVIDSTGRVNAFLIGILTSVFTEGADGRIAAAFKQFFNIASPAATMDHLILVDTATTATTATNLTNAPTAGDFTATMKTSIGTTVAGSSVASVTGNVGGNVVGSVGSVTAGVTVTTNNDKTSYSLAQVFPTNFAALGISVGGHVSNVDTLTTYTGNTPQTGDNYARIGAAGAGLTALGDTRIANLDATVTSRMATYTQPTGFLAATFPSGTLANTTNITAGVITTATNLTNAPTAGDFTAEMKTSLNAATPASVQNITPKLPAGNIADESLLISAINAISSQIGSPVQVGGTVVLSATQPNYAPAKAGDAMTLTAAYDLWTADVKVNKDDVNSKDEWTCIVSKNGVVQDTLTAVSIRIGHRDGSAFIASTAMTAGSDGITWSKDFTTTNRLTAGEDVTVFITATDSLSAPHVCKVIAPITGRDSAA